MKSLFHFGVHRSWLGMAQISFIGPKIAKHGRLVDVPKGTKILTLFGPSRSFDHFKIKIIILAPKHLRKTLLCPSWAKEFICLQWSKRVQSRVSQKTLFQKNKKRNPSRISLRVSLNRSKRIFDFDQV